jgi:hypothetical protein
MQAFLKILAATLTGMSVGQFAHKAKTLFGKSPCWRRHVNSELGGYPVR